MLEAAVPLNDLCLIAIVVPAEAGYPISYHNTQSTLQATSTGDPLITCVNGPVNGVWYKFTPLVDGQLTVRTAGSDFDTVLAVYVGGCGALTQLACNDDSAGATDRTSKIASLRVSANTTYRFLAGGYGGARGNLSFHLDFVAIGTAASVALGDMSASDYQSAFTRWTGAPYGLRLTCVTAYDLGSGPRYAALWANEAGPGYSTRNGMTAGQFHNYNTNYQAQGFQPTFLSAFSSGGVHYYNAIWTYLPRLTAEALVDMSASTFTGQILGKAAAGFSLDYVTTFSDESSDVYAAIWIQGPSSSQCSYGRTAAQYQSDFNKLTGQGYRLVAVSTALSGATPLYSAVFRPPFGQPWYSYVDLSSANYAGEKLNAYYTGFRPSFVSAFTNNNTVAFNAVWTLNGGPAPSAIQPIYDAINGFMNTNGIPGMSLAIARNGRLVFARGFGLADQAANAWVHPDNRFRVASVSKIMTAVGVLRLRDGVGGTLTSLDETLFGSGSLFGNLYGTPPYSLRQQAMTVRELLSHTSGWTNDPVAFDNTLDHAAKISTQLDTVAVSHPPGTFYSYQNINFITAARVIEQVSGLSYGQYIKNQVLAPCGITAMEIGHQTLAGRLSNEAVYYQNPLNPGDPYSINPGLMDGSTAWVARPIDLLLLMRRIDGSDVQADIISTNRFKDMVSGNAASVSQAAYGLATILGGSYFGHNGGMAGTCAWLYHRTDGFDVAFVCNTTPFTNDGGSFNLKAYIDNAINAIPPSAWPDYDLFNSVNTDYDSWSATIFPGYLRAQLGMKADFWGPEADPDGDGIPNLMEAYFQLDPWSATVLPYSALVQNGDFVVRWSRGLFSSLNGVELNTRYKTDLGSPTWLAGPVVNSYLDRFGNVIYETRMPLSVYKRVFQRFQATAP